MDQKLKDWGVPSTDADAIIDELVEGNFLNEERYLTSFVRGKFNNNQWGKRKISFELKSKNFDDVRISDALKKIDENEYHKTARSLILKKSAEITETDSFKRKSKLYQYMNGRGYEADVVLPLINKL